MASDRLIQEQKNIQRQIATQQTIHLMQLVETPITSLEEEIQKEVDENPALEIYCDEEDDHSGPDVPPDIEEYDANGDPLELSAAPAPDDEIFKEDYYRDDDWDSYLSESQIENAIDRLNAVEDKGFASKNRASFNSMQERWQMQLNEMNLTENQADIARYMVGYLDDAGYFTADLQTVVNELLYMYNIYTDVNEVEKILTDFVQELDPPGTGARNLRECLLLQLKRLPQTISVKLSQQVINYCFDDFLKKHYSYIKQQLSISDEQLKAALKTIKKLDPRPADAGTPLDKSADRITPDFIITALDGKLTLALNNQYIPKVRINKEFSNQYRFMNREMREQKRNEAEKFIQQYMDRGNMFIHNLTLRETILYNTMYAIMMHQQQYFLTGDETTLKPMILKTIANEVNLDISTISRVSNSKYVQTDFGIISLKHLFSEAVNDAGISSKEIKQILSELVEGEPKDAPYSDDMLCRMLAARGYSVARRTVSKYRDQLGMPVARLRRDI